MTKGICYWEEFPNGYWEPGCQGKDKKQLIAFPGQTNPVTVCYGICPYCLKDLFEIPKKDPVKDDFLMELNLKEYQ